MHILKLTNGVRLIAHNLLHAPDSFKNPSEVVRAAKIIEDIGCPTVSAEQATPEWHEEGAGEITLTEAGRDLLKAVVEKHASKLPPSKHVVSLLTQLGFTD